MQPVLSRNQRRVGEMKCFYATHGCLNQAESGLAICARCRPYSEQSMAGAWRRMVNASKWTTEPPTEPGWYWVKSVRLHAASVAEISASNIRTRELLFENRWSDFSSVTYWQRIEVPEAPK